MQKHSGPAHCHFAGADDVAGGGDNDDDGGGGHDDNCDGEIGDLDI